MPEEAVKAAEVAAEAATLKATGDREAAVLSVEGQRKVNLMWEATQRWIALAVVAVTVFANFLVIAASGYKLLTAGSAFTPESAAIVSTQMQGSLSGLSSMAMLVIGFYFGRTNHSRKGGVGADEVGR